MRKRPMIAASMAGGVVWAVALLLLARGWWPLRGVDPLQVLGLSLAPGGIVLIVMIGRLAGRRFFDDAIIDGDAFAPGSPAEIDQRVLQNTVEQLVLAVCTWPLIALGLGHGAVLALGLSFGATRLMFWIGYHLSPALRGLGFAAGFYPTILFLAFAILVLASYIA